ncbi:MAG: hypothetical protein BWK79_04450 [Beggiatoa sp. IS2]|nr:MAG: hypothetical protein BWK79_04450 [Beggiatoa sp. IS2]
MKGFLFTITFAGFCFGILAGCTHRPIPLATSYPITAQQKMQAAHHWDVLAEDVAKRFKKMMDLTFVNAMTPPPIYIQSSAAEEQSSFGRVFHRLLANQLVKLGLVVLTSRAMPAQLGAYSDTVNFRDTLVINYDMEVIHYTDRRLTYPIPGTFSLLAGGVWLVSRAVDDWHHPGVAALPIAAAADVYMMKDLYLPGETNTEVVITTGATVNQQHIFGDTSIYYINDGDSDLYYAGGGRTYSIVGCPQPGSCP